MTQFRAILGTLLVASFGAAPAAAHAAGGPASETFNARGVKIHYLLEGQGEAVVLIHGLYSSAAINWQLPGVIGELARDHQVIALDLPGHGRSDKPEKENAFGLQLADDVALLLDHLKIKKAHVVGYSLGGMVALKLIARHPDRVLSGTLGGMGWLPDGSPLQKTWEQMPAREGAGLPPAFIHGIAKLALTEEELKKITAPIKIIVGDRDPVKGLYVAPLEKERKDWPIVTIADAGHINCIMKKQFRDEITAWVRKNSKP